MHSIIFWQHRSRIFRFVFSCVGNVQNTNINNVNYVLTLTYSCLIYAKIPPNWELRDREKYLSTHFMKKSVYFNCLWASFNLSRFSFIPYWALHRARFLPPLFPQGDCMSDAELKGNEPVARFLHVSLWLARNVPTNIDRARKDIGRRFSSINYRFPWANSRKRRIYAILQNWRQFFMGLSCYRSWISS